MMCNIQCQHCGLSSGPQQKNARGPELNTEESLSLFDQLIGFGVSKLIISGGEFTTRPDWQYLLSVALQKFSMVRLITNGWLGINLCQLLNKISDSSNLILSLSLDGIEATHDSNRRAGSFTKVRAILQQERGIIYNVITTVTKSNWYELDQLFDLMRELEVGIWSVQIGLPAGRMSMDNFIGMDNIKLLADKIEAWQRVCGQQMEIVPDDCFGYQHLMRQDQPWTGCQAGKNLVTILANGDITGCPTTFDEVMGNIRQDVLRNIWQNEKFATFREKIATCLICDNHNCLGGCRAVQKIFHQQFCF